MRKVAHNLKSIQGTDYLSPREISAESPVWKGADVMVQLRWRTIKLRATARSLFGSILVAALFAAVLHVDGQEPREKTGQVTTPANVATADEELEKLLKRVAQLNGEVERMRAEIAKLDKYRQIDYTREQITKEEDRIRGLQKDLVELGAREAPLRKRLDEIEAQQPPDRIERSLAGVGSTKPEEVRDAISRQLANEKRQIQTQLDTIQASRARNQSFITNAEESIARLKRRLNELSH